MRSYPVAAEIGVSPSGLKYFLRGGTPYVHTLTRLAGWYDGCCHAITVARLLELLPSRAREGRWPRWWGPCARRARMQECFCRNQWWPH